MDKKYTGGNEIGVSKSISLKRILMKDHRQLYALMKRIYPPAYIDYWKDQGKWYVSDVYSKANLQKELKEENSDYFFVCYEEKVIGILRIVYGIDTHYEADENYAKLHRLYLDQNTQNQGVGYQLMVWLLRAVKEKGCSVLWLEVMEKQDQALYFYQKLGFKKTDKVFLKFPLIHETYRGMYKMEKELN